MYKLLIFFNNDYADEFNIHSLAVMTEEEYLEWCKTPSGILNENFEEELKEYRRIEEGYNKFISILQKENIKNTDKIPLDRKDLLEMKEEFYHKKWRMHYPIKCRSALKAYLGNFGECF